MDIEPKTEAEQSIQDHTEKWSGRIAIAVFILWGLWMVFTQ